MEWRFGNRLTTRNTIFKPPKHQADVLEMMFWNYNATHLFSVSNEQ